MQIFNKFDKASRHVDRLQAQATSATSVLDRADRVVRLLGADIRLQKAALELETINEHTGITRAHPALYHRARHISPLPGWLCAEFRLAQTASFLALDASRDGNRLCPLLSAYGQLVRLGREIGKRRAEALDLETVSDAWIDYFNPGIRLSYLNRLRADIQSHARNKLKTLTAQDYQPAQAPQDELTPDMRKKLAYRLMTSFLKRDNAVIAHFSGPPRTEGIPDEIHLDFGGSEKRALPFMANAYHELCHAALLSKGPVANRAIDETAAKTGDMIFTTADNAAFISDLAGHELHLDSPDWHRERIHAAINAIYPGAPRVEADMLTAPLHACIWMDIDEAMLTGRAKPRELPDYWQATVKRYLGADVTPESVTQETLPLLGRFWEMSSYFLGDIAAPQIYAALERKSPDIGRDFRRGAFRETMAVITQKLDMQTSVTTHEVIRRASGQSLSTQAWKYYTDQRVKSLTLNAAHFP